MFAQDSLLRQDRHLTLPQTPGCGFGWRIGKDPTGEDIVHHSGLAIGARSSLVVYPDARYTVSVLSNAEWVSSIEQTASMLAAPFRTRPNKLASPCPISVARYEGTFGADKIAGTASFSIVDGQCRGVLSTDNAAGAWFNGLFQKDAEQLQIFALTEDGRFGRSALVTPSGIYDFALKADGSYSAVLGATRAFTVRFSSNTAGSSGDR
ncbi:MAG: beta-lactamase family protein [Sphingopyxis sp.]|nr:beta-lactamase family protein [Sphingopyxis sp.]